jgi:hypothetical protein
MKIAYKILDKGRDHLKELNIDVRVMLQWVSRKKSWRVWTEFIWLRTGTCGGLL